MRIARSVLLLTTALMLAGCDQDFATLEFDTSVQPSGYGGTETLKLSYQEALDQLLLREGIDPGLVRARVGASVKTLVLSTALFSDLEPADVTRLKEALQAYPEARKQGLAATFTLQPDKMQGVSQSFLQWVQSLPQSYPVSLTVDDVALGIRYDLQDRLKAIKKGAQTMTSDVSCNIVLEISPVPPFRLLKTERSESGAVTGLSWYSSAHRGQRIPVLLTFDQPELQALWADREISIDSSLSAGIGGINNRRGLSKMELMLGSLGKVEHQSSRVEYYRHLRLRSACRAMGAQLGRPFSFTMGDSLDRLQSVRFY